MNINPINVNKNNSPSFNGVVFSNKRVIAKKGAAFVDGVLESQIVKTFMKRKDYDLHLRLSDNGNWNWKLKSIGQGMLGLLNNLLAPWKKTSKVSSIDCGDIDKYIDKYHLSAEDLKSIWKEDAILSAEARAKLAKQRKDENVLIDKMKKVEEYEFQKPSNPKNSYWS